MILSRKLYNLKVMVIKKNAQIKKLHLAIITAFKKNANPLREYSKTNHKSVKIFIKKNRSKLSSLSIRERMK